MMIGFEVAPVAAGAQVAWHQIGIDRVEPEFGAGGDKRAEWTGHGYLPGVSGQESVVSGL